jgi:RNA-splicing ligase RtcB
MLLEEAPETYKVVETCESVGTSRRVARALPVAVIKG